MKNSTKNIKTNPLRIALIFSVFLHLIGFYFLSNVFFNSALKPQEVAPINVKALVEKKEVQAMNVEYTTQHKTRQFIHSPMPVSIEFNETINSKPTPTYINYSRPQPNRPIAKIPQIIRYIKIVSSNSPSPTIKERQRFFKKKLSIATPKSGKKSKLLYQKTNILPAKYIDSLSKVALTNNYRVRANSSFQPNSTQNFEPTRLHEIIRQKTNKRLILHARNIALIPEFAEEYRETRPLTTVTRISPSSKSLSKLDVGELRRGFNTKIWRKVANAKYYPKMARKRGIEGKPIVTFTLGSKGELLDLKLAQASDYELLNEAALETIRRGSPYPPIPEPLEKNIISFNLPISYTLE